MPNHVTNELIFRDASPNEQNEIVKRLCAPLQPATVDFSILVPEPLNLWMGNEGVDHERAFGKRLGMVWARENWGTKWNAYNTRPVIWTEHTLTLVFDTAWSPPYPWLAAVFNSLKRGFEHNWFDEGASRAVSGRWDYSKLGELAAQPWVERQATDEVHKRLHVLKWGVEAFEDEGA